MFARGTILRDGRRVYPFDLARWDSYNAVQVGRPPRPLCLGLLARAGAGSGRRAVDLGAGAGVETAAMLEAGWRVLAVDPAPATVDVVTRSAPPDHVGRLEVRAVSIQESLPLPATELLHASYALPFVPPSDFAAVWAGVRDALAPGAWVGATFFGDRDQWASDASTADRLTFHGSEDVSALLDGLDVLEVDEQEREGPSFGGTKHWHTLEVVARRPR